MDELIPKDEPNTDMDDNLNRDCYRITLLTGKPWQEDLNDYTLPELIRLQGAMMFFDII